MTIISLAFSDIMIIAFFGIIILSSFSIPVFLFYLIYKWASRKGYKKQFFVILLFLLIWIGYETYYGIYPSNDFYYDEFTEVTLRKPPKSAQIINKPASYPDFHGDYCSASLIKLSKEDYNLLLTELSNDSRLVKGVELIGSRELDKVIGTFKKENVVQSFTRHIPNEEDHYLYIGFLDDKQSVIVTLCVT